MASPAGFEPCDTDALIARGDPNIGCCRVKPGLGEKVSETCRVSIEQRFRIVLACADDVAPRVLDTMRCHKVDFDRGRAYECANARCFTKTLAHPIRQRSISISSSDWREIAPCFGGLEDLSLDAIFWDHPEERCQSSRMLAWSCSAEGQLAILDSLGTIMGGQIVAVAEEPEPCVRNALFIT